MTQSGLGFHGWRPLSAERSTAAPRPGVRPRGWTRPLSVVAALAVLLACAYLAASAYIATTAIHPRRHPPVGTPADVGLAFEPVAFQSATDGTPLRGWYLPSRGERAIVEVHGVNGNRWESDHPWLPRMTAQLVQDGFDVLVFDLRGHGESGGDRTGLGWDERGDVQAAVDAVLQRGIPPGRIGLYGMSLGGGTALLSAASIPSVGAVVTDSAFANQRMVLANEIRLKMNAPPVFTPGVELFARLLYGLDFDVIAPEKALSAIAPRPILFIHGTADTRIPVEHAYRLKAASRNPADELWIVPGAEHTSSYLAQPEAYPTRVLGFFERYLQ